VKVEAAFAVRAELECLSELEWGIVFDFEAANDNDEERAFHWAWLKVILVKLVFDLVKGRLLSCRPWTQASL
jgi:hypothetical protein